MRLLGLLLILAALLLPAVEFVGLAPGRDTVALFSQYLGVCALIAMAITEIIAIRLARIEPLFGPLDRSYILHKWLGIGAMTAILLHDTVDAEMNGHGAETILSELAETWES
jgi:predicted ferric reductase